MLKAESITVGFQGNENKSLLDDFSFEIIKGKFVAILGRNGAGKTTLLKSLIGIYPLFAGAIFLNQQSLSSLSNKERAKEVAWVSTQRTSLNYLSVYEVLATGRAPFTGHLGKLKASDKARIKTVALDQGLIGLLDKQIDQLSDGEYQRVMLAKALIQDTSLILMDEPTAHLDIINRMEIFKRLKELAHQQNKAILIATHELELALNLADEIILLDGNLGYWKGTVQEIVQKEVIKKIFSTKDISFNKNTLRFDYNKSL